MSEKKTDKQIVGNIGMFYACYQLSLLGWNVMPTSRNAKGIDIIAYSPDGKDYLGIQVKTLSKPVHVPLGKEKETIMGDYWIIVVLKDKQNPTCNPTMYVLTKDEVIARGNNYIKNGKKTAFLHKDKYEDEKFKNNLDKIVVLKDHNT